MLRPQWLWLLVCAVFSSAFQCAPQRIPNPYDEIKRLAVAPVFIQDMADASFQSMDGYALGNIMASVLVANGGIDDVVFPKEVEVYRKHHDITLKDNQSFVELARAVKADAILVLQINHYDTWPPPSLSLTMKYLVTHADFAQSNRIKAFSLSGVPPIEEEDSQHVVAHFQRHFDCKQADTIKQIKRYSLLVHTQSQYDWQEIYKNEKSFLAFCFHQVLQDYYQAALDHNAPPPPTNYFTKDAQEPTKP